MFHLSLLLLALLAPGCRLEAAAGPGLRRDFLAALQLPSDPREAAIITGAADSILRTRLGRELAAELVAERVRIPVSFSDTAPCPVYRLHGKVRLDCIDSVLHPNPRGYEVIFNRAYLGMDKEFLDETLPKILAHELLGHGVSLVAADRAGSSAYARWIGDELNAYAVEWIIAGELGQNIDSATPWDMVRDIDSYAGRLQLVNEFYALQFTLPEMLAPEKILPARLKGLQTMDGYHRKTTEKYRSDRWFVQHLLKKHAGQTLAGVKVEARAFGDVAHVYDVWVSTQAPLYDAKSELVRKRVREFDAYMKTGQGKAFMRSLRWSLGSGRAGAFMRSKLDELRRRRAELAALLKGRKRPPVDRPGYVTAQQLERMRDEDIKNGCREALFHGSEQR
jgi:hypothetical protein